MTYKPIPIEAIDKLRFIFKVGEEVFIKKPVNKALRKKYKFIV